MKSSVFGLSRIDLAMIATTVIWGLNYTVVKETLHEMLPMVFVSFRFALAAAFVVIILKLSGENLRFHREDAWKLLLLGIVGNAAHQSLFTLGIARTTASNSSLISATTPIFVTVLSALLHLEAVSSIVGAGVALSFVGTAMVIGLSGSGLSLGNDALLGNLLTLGASMCWSFYTLAARRMMRRYSPLKITALTMLIGSPILLVAASGQMASQDWRAISASGWLGLGYAFVFSSVIAYIIWNTSVNTCGNARTAVYANLIPIIAIAVSWFALGERLVLWQGIGAVITLAGVTLTRLGPRKGAECK